MAQEFWKIIHLTVNGTTIPFKSATLDTKIEPIVLSNGSAINPLYLAHKGQKPTIQVTTEAVKTALDAIGLTAVAVSNDVVIWLGKWDGASLASGSVHKTITVNAGLLVLDRVSARDENEPAECQFTVYATWDGTNAPFVVAEAVAAPTETAIAECFVIGPVVANSITYEVTSFEYSPNAQVRQVNGDGQPYPKRVDIEQCQPTFTVESTDVNMLPDGTSVGQLFTGATFALRKVTADAGRVANATAEHIMFTATKAFGYPTSTSGTFPSASTQGMVFVCRDDGATAAVTLDTTSAIA